MKGLHDTNLRNATQARTAVKRLNLPSTRLDQAGKRVSDAHPQNARQRSGQRDWVAGVREMAGGMSRYPSGLRQLLDGHGPRARGR